MDVDNYLNYIKDKLPVIMGKEDYEFLNRLREAKRRAAYKRFRLDTRNIFADSEQQLKEIKPKYLTLENDPNGLEFGSEEWRNNFNNLELGTPVGSKEDSMWKGRQMYALQQLDENRDILSLTGEPLYDLVSEANPELSETYLSLKKLYLNPAATYNGNLPFNVKRINPEDILIRINK